MRLLAAFPGLASDSAAAAVHIGEIETAVARLEKGRAVLIGHALDARPDLSDLAAVAPNLATQFDELSHALEGSASYSTARWTESPGDLGLRAQSDSRAVSEAWEQLLMKIRAQPGLERFLEPPTMAELTELTAIAPIVVINVSRFRSDALLITTAGIRAVPLPLVSPDVVHRHVADFLDAIQTGRDEHERPLRRQAAEDQIRKILGWLWDAIAEPVLAELGMLSAARPERLPRLWLIPTGELSFLPIHAAGRYPSPAADAEARPLVSLHDLAVCSYAATTRQLSRLNKRSKDRVVHRPLVVATSGSDHMTSLSAAEAEARVVAERCPGGRSLIGGTATKEAVLTELTMSGWAHFACHGISEMSDPSFSRLHLGNGDVAVSDVLALRLEDAEFAMLSACETAKTTTALPDEGIHLSSAFHLAGFRHVVGTLWPIADDVSVELTRCLYWSLRSDPGPLGSSDFDGTARALHAATRQLRRRWPLTPSVWTAWIHVGA
jgi:hypothetical protein